MAQSPYEINRSTYDRIASRFAEINGTMPPNLIEAAGRLLERLAQQPAAQPLAAGPAQLLDLGCGAGRDLAYLESLGVRGFGADLSGGMLAQAHQVTRAPLCQADMRCLPFGPGSFQAVWCSAALLHLPYAEAPHALAEIARVLRRGGLLFVSLQKGSGEGLEAGYNDAQVTRFFARYQLDEFAPLLRQAGFTILDQGERMDERVGKKTWLWFDAQRG